MPVLNPPPPTTHELGDLFRRCAPQLSRLVGAVIEAPPALIEDACQTAWIRLAVQPGVSREQSFSWLTTTALREARRLAAQTAREVSLESIEGPDGGVSTRAEVCEGPHESVAEHLRVQAMRRLSRRQQRLIWLQALGCSYEEIATLTGSSHRTVHRQLVRARARLRALDAG
jgi:RNA polymerase sigma factor (sigma-70 family)